MQRRPLVGRVDGDAASMGLDVERRSRSHEGADIGDRGDFRSDFEINQRRDWRDDRDDYYIEQEINGGGPGLYFKTGKGSIRLIY